MLRYFVDKRAIFYNSFRFDPQALFACTCMRSYVSVCVVRGVQSSERLLNSQGRTRCAYALQRPKKKKKALENGDRRCECNFFDEQQRTAATIHTRTYYTHAHKRLPRIAREIRSIHLIHSVLPRTPHHKHQLFIKPKPSIVSVIINVLFFIRRIPKSEPKATNMLTRWLRDLRGSTILRSNSNLEDQSPTLSTKQKTIQVSRSQSTLVAHKPTRKKNNDNRRYSFNDHALQNQKRY